MPTYEYKCNACQREFEYQQRMADDDLIKCEVCGEDKLEKLISRTAFQLKGGGWYKDLYSSKPAEAMKDSVDKAGKPPAADKPAGDKAAAKSDGAGTTSSSDGGGSTSGGGSTTASPSPATSTPAPSTPKPASGG